MATRSTKPSAMTTSYAMQSILTDVVSAGTEAPLGYGLGYSIFYYYCASNAVLEYGAIHQAAFWGRYRTHGRNDPAMAATLCLCRPAQGHSGGYAWPDGSLRSCSPKTASAVFETPAMAHSNKNKRGSTIRCSPSLLVCFLLSASGSTEASGFFCRRFPQAAVLNMRIDHCGIDAGMA